MEGSDEDVDPTAREVIPEINVDPNYDERSNRKRLHAAILQKGIVSTKPDAIQEIYRDRNVVSYKAIEFMLKAIQ
jgi:hypothetical protein